MFDLNPAILYELKIEELKFFKPDAFKAEVKKLADHILCKNDRKLEHHVNGCSLKVVELNFLEEMNSLWNNLFRVTELPSLDVLKDLRAILLTAEEKGLGEYLKKEIAIISELANKIIIAHPPSPILLENFPKELLGTILHKIRTKETLENFPKELLGTILHKIRTKETVELLQEIGTKRSVSKSWNEIALCVQVHILNDSRLPLRYLLPDSARMKRIEYVGYTPGRQPMAYKKAQHKVRFDAQLDWLKEKPALNSLKYANFDIMCLDNENLEVLTKNCPKLEYLEINCLELKEDALKYLKDTPNLLKLFISNCYHLEKDALKHLIHTPKLQDLKIKMHNSDDLSLEALPANLTPILKIKSTEFQFEFRSASQFVISQGRGAFWEEKARRF